MKNYDPGQLSAINSEGGYYLVLAPPGCGKTDILSERIVYAKGQDVSFEDMLCLTFTNRASREMKKRIFERVGEDASKIFVGNVHRFCSNFLYSNSLISENTSIIDDYDMAEILISFDSSFFKRSRGAVCKTKVKEVNDIGSYLFQKRLNHPENIFILPSIYEQYYELAVKYSFDPDRLPDSNDYLKYALQYSQYKKEKNLIDFSDLLILAYEYLRNDTIGAFKRYKWIQIDEVQDLNQLQMAIVDELLDTSGNFTAMYLGDEQQAIFSFMGAELELMDKLRCRCEGHILTLGTNYRSPDYLLEVFNRYAEEELMVHRSLLPKPNNYVKPEKWSLILADSDSPQDEYDRILKMVKYYLKFDDERLAILVPTNLSADIISKKLIDEGVSHFKISGTDMFRSSSFKTLSSFFNVLVNDFNTLAWARLLNGIGAFRTQIGASNFIMKLKQLMMTPSDLLEGESYVSRFHKLYSSREFVLFDTETTGLNVLEDDIVQISAFKVYRGCKVRGSDFNVFIETDRPIPEKLGGVANPLIEVYQTHRHLSKREAFSSFLKYIGDDPVIGHNVNYDYIILQNNVRRSLQEEVTLEIFDSLRLVKCVEPFLRVYKLASLMKELKLSGKNSHLADEDIEATKALIDYCYVKSGRILKAQESFISEPKVKNVINNAQILIPLFDNINNHLFLPVMTTQRTIVDELKSVYDDMRNHNLISSIGPKFDVFLKYAQAEWIDPESDETLYNQIIMHIHDMTSTINEGDLVNSGDLVQERVFIMTVYKGKGLEFDNVVVQGANDGTYPFFSVNNVLYSSDCAPEEMAIAQRERMEDARKFYVAISRAKKRLCVSYTNFSPNHNPMRLTPFMKSIREYFYSGKK